MNCKNYSSNGNAHVRQQLLNTLRRLWFEHVMWTRAFITSTAFNSPDLDPVTKRLLRNPTDFATVLKDLYGSAKASQFEKLFTDHLLIASDLVNAAKSGDTNAVDAARKRWYANASDIASFMNEINPYWSKDKWQAMLGDHLKMTENEAVQMLSGKFAESISQYDAIQAEALKMADEMAIGILKQFRM